MQEFDELRHRLSEHLPDGVKLLVTNTAIDLTVVSNADAEQVTGPLSVQIQSDEEPMRA